MPRTATILGKKHDGVWVLISPPSDDFLTQLKRWKEVRLKQSDETFQQIQYQESDGTAAVHYIRSPKDQKSYDARRDEEKQKHIDAKKRFEDSCNEASNEVGAASAAVYKKRVEAEQARMAADKELAAEQAKAAKPLVEEPALQFKQQEQQQHKLDDIIKKNVKVDDQPPAAPPPRKQQGNGGKEK